MEGCEAGGDAVARCSRLRGWCVRPTRPVYASPRSSNVHDRFTWFIFGWLFCQRAKKVFLLQFSDILHICGVSCVLSVCISLWVIHKGNGESYNYAHDFLANHCCFVCERQFCWNCWNCCLSDSACTGALTKTVARTLDITRRRLLCWRLVI